MKYKPYPKYKDSGIEWIGEIPEGWEVFILKRILSVSSGDMISSDDELPEGFPIYGGNGIRGYTYKSNAKGPMILIGRVGAKCGCIHKVDGEFWASEHALKVVSKRKFDIDFYKYFLEIIDLNRQAIRTAQPLINTTIVENHETVFPPLNHQEHIATFLDTKTAQIDALIEKKQRQIELLKEKRSALITHAVTKGLDPNVKMKDSGIEWIGEIPEGWISLKIKRLSLVKRGASPRPIDDQIYFSINGEYSWVRISDVTASNHYLYETTQRLSTLGKNLSVPLEPGDIFLSIAGSVGKPIITRIKCCIHDGFVYFPYYQHNKEFLYYIFMCGQPYVGLGKLGTQLNLNTETVGGITIGLPPIEEQERIVQYLDTKTAQIDALIKKVKKSIDLLKEYRSALITAAVTGKIDVRGMN